MDIDCIYRSPSPSPRGRRSRAAGSGAPPLRRRSARATTTAACSRFRPTAGSSSTAGRAAPSSRTAPPGRSSTRGRYSATSQPRPTAGLLIPIHCFLRTNSNSSSSSNNNNNLLLPLPPRSHFCQPHFLEFPLVCGKILNGHAFACYNLQSCLSWRFQIPSNVS